MLARVEAQPGTPAPRYRLAEVAVGLGTRIGDRDVIVTAETGSRLGANLGVLGGLALSRGYARLHEVPSVVRSDTMIIIDGATTMVRGDRHRPVVLRYVNMVDPKTGRLDSLMWAIDRDDHGKYLGVDGVMEWLPPNMVQGRVLHVDAREFSFGLITESALAMTRLYHGQKQITIPESFRSLAGASALTPESAAQMETTLRELLRRAEAGH
jgi:hypothetical protein